MTLAFVKANRGVLSFLIAGLLSTSLGVGLLWMGHAAVGWPVVTGRIVSASVKGPTSKRNSTYSADVTYEYTVDSDRFIGHDIWLTRQAHGDSAAARKDLRSYPVGGEVTVHYDRRHPQTAFLVTGIDTDDWFCVALGAVLLFVGGIGLFGAVKTRSDTLPRLDTGQSAA